MKLHLANFEEKKIFTGYGDDHVMINQIRYEKNVILLPDQIIDHWPILSITQLTIHDFECIFPHQPEIIILGTGNQHQFPDYQLMSQIMTKGIGMEVMDTKAACRTYNILAEEGRHIAAAIYLT